MPHHLGSMPNNIMTLNGYQKRTKPLANYDASGSFLLPTGTIAKRLGDTPQASLVAPVDIYKS
jgi:hypothetical protein